MKLDNATQQKITQRLNQNLSRQTPGTIVEFHQELKPLHLNFQAKRIQHQKQYLLKVWEDNSCIAIFDWADSIKTIFTKFNTYLTNRENQCGSYSSDDGFVPITPTASKQNVNPKDTPTPKDQNTKKESMNDEFVPIIKRFEEPKSDFQPVKKVQPKDPDTEKQSMNGGFIPVIEEFEEPKPDFKRENRVQYEKPISHKRHSNKNMFKAFSIIGLIIIVLIGFFFSFKKLGNFYNSPSFLNNIQPTEHVVTDLDIYKNTLFLKPGDVVALPLLNYDANACDDVYIISREIVQDGKVVSMPFLVVDPQASEGMVNAIEIKNGDHIEKLFIMITNVTELDFQQKLNSEE